MTSIPHYGEDSTPEADINSLKKVETLLMEGHAEEVLELIERMELEINEPELKTKLLILKIRTYLALGDKDSAENTFRKIFQLDLEDKIQMDCLTEDVRSLYKKIRPEYWFTLKEEGKDKEAFNQLVIQQYQKKPKKKKFLAKLILGTLLFGAVVSAILLITTGSKEAEDKGDLGTLKFENRNNWDVTIEIYGIVKNVLGKIYNTWQNPYKNLVYIELPPGIHSMTVTSTNPQINETKVLVYSVEIFTGQATYFSFTHP
jgi:hypothetical protein